tara:strand:- start:358 stop:525 length:168 start_codon:yes stop_codon:yes gene_type:complete
MVVSKSRKDIMNFENVNKEITVPFLLYGRATNDHKIIHERTSNCRISYYVHELHG